MEKQIIGRGILAGALAGVFAFVFAKIFVEPVIERAIDFEDGVGAAHEAMEHAHGGEGHEHGVEVFTRGVQSNIGMGLGVLAFSVAMGALLAVVFCVLYGRTGTVSARACGADRRRHAGFAVDCSGAEVPTQPARRQPRRDDQAADVALPADGGAVGRAVRRGDLLGRRLAPKLGAWNATLAAGGAYVVAVAVVMLILPTIDETPGPLRDDAGNILFEGFPADDLYQFRLFSLGTQVVMWATIGLVFGALVSRLLDGKRQERLTA